MTLSHVLAAKIVLTAIFWGVPLLASPVELYAALDIPQPVPILLPRLLGAAYLALMVVYWFGWADVRAGRHPQAAVRAGLVSNGLAAILLAVHGVAGYWDHWGWLGRAYMWASLVAAASLTAGLLAVSKERAEASDAADSR